MTTLIALAAGITLAVACIWSGPAIHPHPRRVR